MGPVTLTGKLDFAAAEGLRVELAERRGTDLVLDASGVQHLGAAVLQVLISAVTSWRADGRSMTVTSASDEWLTALGEFGLPTDWKAALGGAQ